LGQQSIIPEVAELFVDSEPEQYFSQSENTEYSEPSSVSSPLHETDSYFTPQHDNSSYEVVSSPESYLFSGQEADNAWIEAAPWNDFPNFEQTF
jgi:hypothetical protein